MVAKARRPSATSPSRFGARRSGSTRHKGVDLYAPKGTPVSAPAAGVVVRAQTEYVDGFDDLGRLVVVKLDDGGGELLAAHLEGVSVAQGQRVQEGDVLGTVGDTAFPRRNPSARFDTSKPHTHVELLMGHSYPVRKAILRQNPMALAFYAATKKKRAAA